MEKQQQSYTYLETNGEFRMRELDQGDLEQFNALLQYAFQVTSYELFQTGWKQEEIKYAKRPILDEAYVLGWFYQDKLASMIVVYSMKVNEIMTRNPVCIAEGRLAVDAMKVLHEKNISSLIVLDSQGDYTGVVTLQMVINAL